MKKLFSLILCTLVIAGVNTSYALSNDVKIVVDGEVLSADVGAFIENNRTFVPLRFIIESFNEGISWDDATKTVSIVTK